MNPKLTPKERGLLKGSIRRVFARSELRQQVLQTVRIDHYDADRPRVKKWGLCPGCLLKVPLYKFQVDHKDPVIPTNSSFEEMTLDEVVDRTWTTENNLTPLCESCHTVKTKAESAERKRHKKGKIKK